MNSQISMDGGESPGMKPTFLQHAKESPVIQILGFALLWEICARTILARWQVLPPPSAILITLWESRWSLYPHLVTTGQEAFFGYLWGNAAAILLAVIAFLLPSIEPIVGRITLVIHCLPLLVLAPILQILFSNTMPMIILSGVFVLFTTFIAALVGLREVDQQSILVVRAFGGSKKDELLRVRFVAWLPSLLGGLSQAAPAAVVGAMVGEYMGSTSGLGVAMIYAQSSFQIDRTWAICLLATSLALLAYGAVQLLGWWLTPWARDQKPIALFGVVNEPIQGKKWVRRMKLIVAYALSAGAGLGLWYAFIWVFALDPYFAKTPLDLWNYLVTDPDAGSHRNQFLQPTLVTLGHAGGGLLLGFSLALFTAILIRFWRSLERSLTPYLVLISSIPVAALIPIISLVCGISSRSVMAAVALLTFLPSFITILVGLKSAPEQASNLVWVAGGSWWRAVWMIQVPFALPWLLAAFKAAAPLALGGSLLGEWLITGDGLAMVMEQSRSSGDYTAIWTAGIWIVLLSLGFYTVISMVEVPVLSRLSLRGN
jgi:sulfonate transport system permease protein